MSTVTPARLYILAVVVCCHALCVRSNVYTTIRREAIIKRLLAKEASSNSIDNYRNFRRLNSSDGKNSTFDCTKKGNGCAHGGTCDPETGLCTCVKPWQGNTCSECGCKHGGTCEGENSCSCPSGFDPKSWCSLCIQGHGGPSCSVCSCGDHGACNPSPSSAMCQCYFPYIGTHCTQCGCFNGGICTNASSGRSFYGCICKNNFDAESSCLDCIAGYYKVSGSNPRHNDKCLECPGGKDNPCSKNGICTSDGTCKCLDGWVGPFCGTRKTEAFIIPENIVIFVSIGVGALFVGLIAMSFLVLSKQIDYAALGTPSNADSATTSNSSGFGSVGNMNKSVDDSITRALLRKSMNIWRHQTHGRLWHNRWK